MDFLVLSKQTCFVLETKLKFFQKLTQMMEKVTGGGRYFFEKFTGVGSVTFLFFTGVGPVAYGNPG